MSYRHQHPIIDRASAPPDPHTRHRCIAAGCGRTTMRGAGIGLSPIYCRYHIGHRARHGSTWAKTIPGIALEVRLEAAGEWLAARREDPMVNRALDGLKAVLEDAGKAERVQDLAKQSPAAKASAALARYRDAGFGPETLLLRCLAVLAVIEEPEGLAVERSKLYSRVQIAKAVNRLVPAAKALRWHGGQPEATWAWTPSRGRYLRHEGEAILMPVWESLGPAAVSEVVALVAARRTRTKRSGRPTNEERRQRKAEADKDFWTRALEQSSPAKRKARRRWTGTGWEFV